MALLYSEGKSNETMSECLERFISHCTGDTSLLEKFLLECRIDEINQYIKKHNIDVNEALSLIKELHNIGLNGDKVMRSLHENKNNHIDRSDNSMAKQPIMSYERAYKEIYETFVLWLVEFKQMKPDKDFSEDRIDGALTSLASIVAEMEDYKPEIKIIREEIETWGKDLKGDKNESRNKNARRNTETDHGQR